MFKNKVLILLIVGIMVAGLALTGCGESEVELSFGTGGTAGTYYPLGSAIANVWSDNIDGYQVTVQPTGASVENIRLLNTGEADIVMAMNNIAEDAWYGDGSFEDDGEIKNFKAVGVVYPEIIQGVAVADSGIETIYDLEGARVAPGPVGSGTQATTPHIFGAYGLTFDDMETHFDTFGDAVDKMKDGHLDAGWNVLAAPAAAIVDLLTAREVVFLEIKGEELETLMDEFPLVAPHVIPAGTYDYRGEPYDEIHTIALQAVMYVSDDLDEDLVYDLTKVMYEQNEDIAAQHARGDQILLENALNGVTTDFHPGAIKYFEEQGLM